MDRAGKTLQRRLLLEELRERGHSPVSRWTRVGYTRRLEAAKRLLRRLRGRKPRAADDAPRRYPQRASQMKSPLRRWLWTTVALLDLFYEHAIEIRRIRARGHAVVCDRGLIDALVDFRVNFPRDRVDQRLIWRLLLRFAVRPEATFLLLVSPQESIRRAHASGRRHVEPAGVLEARLAEYRRIAAAWELETIDAEQDPERVALQLRAQLGRAVGPAGLGAGLAA
jgi:thymidylate kinase